MKAVLRDLLRISLLMLAKAGVVRALSFLIAPLIVRIHQEAGPVSGDGPTLLALNPARFRGDLGVLSGTGLRVYRLPFRVQAFLVPIFYGRPIPEFRRADVIRHPDVRRRQSQYRGLLVSVLLGLRERLGIECVVGAAVHYLQDVDWGAAARQAQMPYVVLHREGMISSERWRSDLVDFYSELRPFEGDLIIAWTAVSKSVFVESGFCRPQDVAVGGVLRMDPFLEDLNQFASTGRHHRVTLFSFHHSVGLAPNIRSDPQRFDGMWSGDGRSGYVALFDATHAAMARFALENPEIEVVIKPKWGSDWITRVQMAIGQAGFEVDSFPNLIVDHRLDPHELIRTSDVVCGFGSTTLLEAAVAGKPVVMPYFAEAVEYEEYVPFGGELDLFELAHSPDEIVELLAARFRAPAVTESVMERRRQAFETYVSPVQGRATERYVGLIRETINGFG